MYPFSYFKESDKQVLLNFVRQHPFAFLTGSFANGQQVATQVPILLEERLGHWYAQGHIMKQTDHHKAFTENPNALLVFSGPHAYVSASWYTDPHIGSTWNYMSVHLAGKINFMSLEALKAFMQKLSLHFEDGNPQSPTFYDNLPESFLSHMMPAIAGFELKIESLENVFKLSQNRNKQSYINIINKLEERGGDSALIALEMRKRFHQLFNNNTPENPNHFDS